MMNVQATKRVMNQERQLANELVRSDELHKQVIELQKFLADSQASEKISELELERQSAMWRAQVDELKAEIATLHADKVGLLDEIQAQNREKEDLKLENERDQRRLFACILKHSSISNKA